MIDPPVPPLVTADLLHEKQQVFLALKRHLEQSVLTNKNNKLLAALSFYSPCRRGS